jgi:hypothetical protein
MTGAIVLDGAALTPDAVAALSFEAARALVRAGP